jgi:pimeloyl-ACP methyl ester carboxylesterase
MTYNSTQLTRRQFAAAASALACGAGRVFAQQPVIIDPEIAREIDNLMNFLTKTAGGKQFWADLWFFHEWRIQRNALTGHYRLLDAANNRRASGTLDECRAAMDAIRTREKLPPMAGRAVIVLHGLFRTRSAMQPLCDALAKGGAFKSFNVGYPTTRGSVAEHAASLDSVIRSLVGITELNFVGHSLGNLVVRHWLGELAGGTRKLPAGMRFGRMVMLAPPNQHPQLATTLIRGELAEAVAGAAACELATGWETLAPNLATPPFDFGILAGGRGDGRGFNPLLPGDDDAVVTVESTRLVGARDFRLLPLLHSFLMYDTRVKELALRFLTDGHFESDAKRQPIKA